MAPSIAENNAARRAGEREIAAPRVYDVPRELVWEMWTEPEHIVQWWGRTGSRPRSTKWTMRPKEVGRLVMHGPDGRDYKNRNIYLEVNEPERLVYEHSPTREASRSIFR